MKDWKINWHWVLIGLGAGIIVLDLLFYLLVLGPARRAYASGKSEQGDVVKAVTEKQAAVKKLESVQAHLQGAAGGEALQFDQHLWTSSDGFSSILEFLSDITNRTAVQRGRVMFKSSSYQALGLMEVRMDVPLEGTYPDVVRFINSIERSDKLLIIDSVVLLTGQGSSALLRLSLSLTTYMKI